MSVNVWKVIIVIKGEFKIVLKMNYYLNIKVILKLLK
jgi:hypothetical protein